MLTLAQSAVDPRDWMQWALDRGVNGVLMLACFVLFTMLIRVYKEKNRLHADRAKLEESYRRAQASAAEATTKKVEDLETAFREKVEQLLREQVKLAKETTGTLTDATMVLKSLHAWLDAQNFADQQSAPPPGGKA